MMNFLKRHKRILMKLGAVSALGLLIFLASPKPANACAFFCISDIFYYVIAKVMFGVSYIIATLGGIVIAIEAWMVGFFLQVNTGVVTSPPVAFGFPVMLSITNLGFVLVIIWIAIATILRRENYGIKRTLWKLIIAAIMVNFSLPIASIFLNFSDSFSFYFLQCIDPTGGGCTGQQSGLPFVSDNSFNHFSSSLAGAFNPQQSFLGWQQNGVGNSKSDADVAQNAFSTSGELGADVGALFKPFAGLVFTIMELAVIILALGTLIIVLIVRYVALGILLILMPFVWLCWVL